MYKINLHAHSIYSDGDSTLSELVNMAESLGHTALVVTDHDWYLDSFEKGHNKIESLKDAPIPIILGQEISTPFGDCLLFGEKALLAYNGLHISMNKINYSMYYFYKYGVVAKHSDWLQQERYLKLFTERMKDENYALVLCHPFQYEIDSENMKDRVLSSHEKEFFQLIHGVEVQNNKDCINIEWLFQHMKHGVKKLKNSDAHCLKDMSTCCNETEFPIKNENDLIFWLKTEIESQTLKQTFHTTFHNDNMSINPLSPSDLTNPQNNDNK